MIDWAGLDKCCDAIANTNNTKMEELRNDNGSGFDISHVFKSHCGIRHLIYGYHMPPCLTSR